MEENYNSRCINTFKTNVILEPPRKQVLSCSKTWLFSRTGKLNPSSLVKWRKYVENVIDYELGHYIKLNIIASKYWKESIYIAI